MSADNSQQLVDERSVGQSNDLSQQTQRKKKKYALKL